MKCLFRKTLSGSLLRHVLPYYVAFEVDEISDLL